MAETGTWIDAPPDVVYDVLADADSYAHWVVGSSQIRERDASWPEPGSTFHHVQGFFGVGLHDTTTVVASQRPRQLVLKARFRPFMVAKVELRLRPAGRGTRVKMIEYPVGGIAARVHNPLLDRLIWARNVESLRRLRRMAEERAARRGAGPARDPATQAA